MALADIRKLLENRLHDLVPNESLAPGSRAQVDFIQPVLDKLGSDPISLPIEAFIDDRFSQEFPDVFQGSPSMVRDIFSKPLRVLLEPFKREVQNIHQNQSLKDPNLLSDDDADALVANIFFERPEGGFSSGTGRLFFNNPLNVTAEITNRFFTATGKNFFPTSPVSITAEEMVFNRDGALFFFDVPVRAEKADASYNIDVNELTGVEGVFGVVRVGNPRKFIDGSNTLDTPSFIAQASQALSERSLVTRRGAAARINHDFSGQVRAVQVIGAKDPEMQRDLLVATSPGHAWLTGHVNLYKQVAYVRARTVEGSATSDVVKVGDTLYVYFPASAYPGLASNSRFARLTVTAVLAGPLLPPTPPVSGLTGAIGPQNPFQVSYFVQWSGTLPLTVSGAVTLEGGFAKKGTVQISSIPDIGPVTLTANNGEVHVYGHNDVYVRPVLQPASKATLTGIFDYKSLIERELLTTNGAAGSDKNRITDSGSLDFAAQGVAPGDLVVIEQGSDAGTYVVGAVATTFIYLTTNLSTTASNLRYRVLKKIRVDPFEPKIPRFPFGALLANDLSTTIGSKRAVFATNDLLNYGAKVGDTLRIKTGLDAGDFTITAFDTVLGGRGVILDRAAASSNANLSYEVFTPLDTLAKPLVRVKSVELLDSSKQSTGISVPPADPIAVVPTCSFTSARVRAGSARRSGYILPDLGPLYSTSLISSTNFAASAGDRRYSLAFDTPQGFFRSMLSLDGTKAELDFRTDSKGACSYFLAVAETNGDVLNLPPIDPKPGDALTLKSGPNAGSYLIKAVYKFRFHETGGQEEQCYFIQIYGTFPMDPIGRLIEFLQAAGGAAVPTAIAAGADISIPGFFQTFRDTLGSKLDTAFGIFGATSPGPTVLQAMVLDQIQIDYEWGDPARGVLRTYFEEPTLFEQWTGLHSPVTSYQFTTPTGERIKFRPDPNKYLKQQLIPARLSSDTDPLSLPRDLDASVAAAATLTDVTKPSPFNIGVSSGDFLSVFQENFFLGATKNTPLAVQTVAGSTVVTAPSASGTPFSASMVGNLFSIEEGADKSMYRVAKFIDANNLQLDRQLMATTPTILQQGSAATWQFDGVNDVITAAVAIASDKLNKYITIYGINPAFEGSFKITATNVGANPNKISVDRGAAGHFPGGLGSNLFWAITDAPVSAPVIVGTATELFGLRPIRMYQGLPHDYPVTGFPTNNPTAYTVNITGTIPDGFKQPYYIYRPNIRRVTPTEMSLNTDGPYCFFDTDVVAASPQPGANLHEASYLTVDPTTFASIGYRHVVADSNLTYSLDESGWLDLPLRVLPVGSVDRYDSFIILVGAPVLIQYETADIVRQLQSFVDSPLDRVAVSNTLVRHFLPQYVSYEATYFGGSAPSGIAKSIIDRVNSLRVETPLDVSEDLEKEITNGGGNPETPTKVMLLTHDWKRQRWLETSQNKIGGVTTLVPYAGTPRVAFMIPGPDVSGQNPLPTGERINLIRG